MDFIYVSLFHPLFQYAFKRPLKISLGARYNFLLGYLLKIAHSDNMKLCILMQDLFTCQKLFWMEVK